MFILSADAASSDICFREFSVLTLNVDTSMFRLHLKSLVLLMFLLLLLLLIGSVADFSNTVATADTTAERAPCVTARRAMRHDLRCV